MQHRTPEGRSRGTLLAVVRTHIQTGEPVASRTISRQSRERLSPASIRNIMMELEEEGYLEQPHTSAGRVPTGKAYQFYASQVDATHPPSRTDEQLILSLLGNVADLSEDEVLERTSRALSLVSNNLGVVIRQPERAAVLEHIYFVNLGARRILVVLVSPSAQIHQRVIPVDGELSRLELEAAAAYLNTHFQGWELGKIREELTRRLAEERTAYDRLVQALKQLHQRGIIPEASPQDLFVDGASNLIGKPELANPARLRELIRALEEKETIVRLLNECIRPQQEPPQVVVGLPGKPPLFRDFALVGSAFCWSGRAAGRMAILGPARMPYERVIRAMGYIERLFMSTNAN